MLIGKNAYVITLMGIKQRGISVWQETSYQVRKKNKADVLNSNRINFAIVHLLCALSAAASEPHLQISVKDDTAGRVSADLSGIGNLQTTKPGFTFCQHFCSSILYCISCYPIIQTVVNFSRAMSIFKSCVQVFQTFARVVKFKDFNKSCKSNSLTVVPVFRSCELYLQLSLQNSHGTSSCRQSTNTMTFTISKLKLACSKLFTISMYLKLHVSCHKIQLPEKLQILSQT